MDGTKEMDAVEYVEQALRALKAVGAQPRAQPAVVERLTRVLLATARQPSPRAAVTKPDERPSATPSAPEAPTPAARAVRRSVGTVPSEEPWTPIAPAAGTNAERLAAMALQVAQCVKCDHLVGFRHNVVFGIGNPEAELMFVGEAPGAEEDIQGEPFIGRAGQLLTKIIEAMGLTRQSVYIANVLKCRPDMPEGATGNRPPTPLEMRTCKPYLREQIAIIRPKVIVALGSTALQGLLLSNAMISKIRGQWQEYDGIPVMPTFHPSYLLRPQSDGAKRLVWEDMLAVMKHLSIPISEKQQGYFLNRR
jgi:DNA polymerase